MPTNILEAPLCIPSVFPLYSLCIPSVFPLYSLCGSSVDPLCYSALESLPDLDEFLLLKP
jgi:hypothetical protein